MPLEIRPYDPKDKDGVRDLILPIQRDEFGIEITYADQPDLQDIETFYRRGSGEFWVAVSDDRVVGTIALIDIGNHQAALRKMFVDAAFRGKDAGVAFQLLERLLAHARQEGLKEVYLGTTSSFLAAHRFYEKSGFALVEEADLPDAFPKMAVDSRFYRYGLA